MYTFSLLLLHNIRQMMLINVKNNFVHVPPRMIRRKQIIKMNGTSDSLLPIKH